MKSYTGKRLDEGCEVYVEEGGKAYPLPLHLEIRNHSPTGFEWNYGGSGPSQLALAICADYFGQDPIPEACPFCGTKMKESWKCPERYACGYDGEKEGDCWRSITGGLVHYMTFKRDFLANLGETWVILGENIDRWAACQRQPNFPA